MAGMGQVEPPSILTQASMLLSGALDPECFPPVRWPQRNRGKAWLDPRFRTAQTLPGQVREQVEAGRALRVHGTLNL
ncbi:uncharacterized protein SPSK_05763 [Sporothrix schenckii 1099-18]|uniref:Uncharacterized protein n=1 Tax=Sporothrix schenckii 1099-18 TaxID=1397361 RepID=A0A0F2LVS2_SPOSC|nr:uncharacterized protein SPSK_05763 [Sporothrix schenckii 1099-18]KJR80934.1 hypothetical protein SPSK_05763 [Sporothrix schenckii 1099-18]